jgi:hypothetical protein
MQVGSFLNRLCRAFALVQVEAVALAMAVMTPSGQHVGSGDAALHGEELHQLAVQLGATLDNCDEGEEAPMKLLPCPRSGRYPLRRRSPSCCGRYGNRQGIGGEGMAEAAATHCCAYLGCAQLGARGGPGAGEGTGSKRCSRTRVAWYMLAY